jgi:adenylosuccinate synthase
MPADVIIGSQWGDEGKGKIVDVLSNDYDVIVRYQGGSNAGHTVIVGKEKYVLHLLPSGVLHPKQVNLIGHSVVADLEALIFEIEELKKRGVSITPAQLMISENTQVVLPYHKAIDQARESKKGDKKIGTTGRGIGPAYTDKYARTGIRVRDLFDEAGLKQKIEANLEEKNYLLKNLYGAPEIKTADILAQLKTSASYLKPYIKDTVWEINKLLKAGKSALFEGAQGALLDIDMGTYPYVTSSNPTIGGALTGMGIAAKYLRKIIGITKAYQTRVGNGPFPTEMDDAIGQKTREAGGEYGATTGRPRRCGWLDLVALKFVCDTNGLTEIVLTKADVLSIFDTLKVALKYDYKGDVSDRFITDGEALYNCKPVYTEVKGWSKDLTGIKKYGALPKEMKDYVKFIEDFVKVKISYVSVGPDREQTLKK